MKPGYVVAAEIHPDGRLTGSAKEVTAREGDELCQGGKYTTFGTWAAYQGAISAQETE